MAKKVIPSTEQTNTAKVIKTVKPKAAAKVPASAAAKKTMPDVIVQKYNVHPYSRFTDFDIDLFKAGKHYKLYEKLGSHVVEHDGVVGTYFAVWAPNAKFVAVIGNFNGWDRGLESLKLPWDAPRILEGLFPHI